MKRKSGNLPASRPQKVSWVMKNVAFFIAFFVPDNPAANHH
jgi:hypothetical protein